MTNGTRSPASTAGGGGTLGDATALRDDPDSPRGGAPGATAREYAVPAGETPAARCPYCDRPFERERLSRLHVGGAHRRECTDAELAAYETAYDAESDDLFRYQLSLVAALVVLTFGFVYVYAVALTV